jgi:outer membrane protein TolC
MIFRITLFFFISLLSFSQETAIRLSLEQAIELGQENNTAAKNAQYDIRLAKLQKWQTTSTGLPQISANINYNNWIKQQVSLIPAEFFGGSPGQFAEITFGTTQTMNGTVTISQKIFDGTYLVGLQAAKIYLEISENAKEKTHLEVRQLVAFSYGNVLLAEENLKIINANIENLKSNLIELQAVYQNGLVEEESVEQLQLTLSSLESNQNYINRLKTIAYQMLNNTIGIDIETPLVLTDSLEDLAISASTTELNPNLYRFENSVDYKIALNDLKSKELLLKLEKSKALPTLDVFINGSYSGNNNRFEFFDNSQKWFGASLFGVNMNIPIFSSFGRSSNTQKAQVNLNKSKASLENTSQLIKLEISKAKTELQFAVENHENKKQALSLAERIESKNQIKFSEGVATSFELAQAQTQLYSAQQDYLQSMLTILNKKYTLETITNTF